MAEVHNAGARQCPLERHGPRTVTRTCLITCLRHERCRFTLEPVLLPLKITGLVHTNSPCSQSLDRVRNPVEWAAGILPRLQNHCEPSGCIRCAQCPVREERSKGVKDVLLEHISGDCLGQPFNTSHVPLARVRLVRAVFIGSCNSADRNIQATRRLERERHIVALLHTIKERPQLGSKVGVRTRLLIG